MAETIMRQGIRIKMGPFITFQQVQLGKIILVNIFQCQTAKNIALWVIFQPHSCGMNSVFIDIMIPKTIYIELGLDWAECS